MRALRASSAAGIGCWCAETGAHGFGQRFDLPLPLWLWLTGAGLTIVVTFAAVAALARGSRLSAGYPSADLLRYAPVRVLAGPWPIAFIRALGAALFALTIAAGLFGAQDAYANLITTMVWVIWWVGCAFVCALVGNVWALANPLATVFAAFEWTYAKLTHGRALARALPYPQWLGAWPGVLLFLCFVWAELVWEHNDVPANLARALIAYAVVTWIGMFTFGREVWLAHGEAFAIAFGILARFAPLALTGSRLELRPPGTGLIAARPVCVSLTAFALLMLASVTYDGFLETPLNQKLATAMHGSPAAAALLFEASEWGLDETQIVATLTLIVFACGFIALYWLAAALMTHATGRAVSVHAAAGWFVMTLVPIAVAYHLAHYFSLLLTAGQFIIPLASDPFGFGWNLLGTAHYKVDLAIVSPYVLWYGAVALIVIGHVIAVVLAHLTATRAFADARSAFVSQLPMMVLMVAYTASSLWILAQPIVA